MRKTLLRLTSFISLLAILLTAVALPAHATDYRTGANAASASYKSGRYYQHLMQVPITGDGVTDVLAVALSQLGYLEGNSAGAYSGESAGSGNYSEYYYNFGMATNTWSMEWCAAFVSWSLYQAKVSNQGSLNDWCRNHLGDGNYIWREISCYYWSNQLQRVGRYQYRGSYTPKSGDLIFFNRSGSVGHIGIVVWCDGSTVYTIEGNTGNGVYYRSYPLSSNEINGYGLLPYASNASVPKVDYSGNTFSTGLYMVKTGQSLSAGGFTVPAHRMFSVTSISGSTATVVYNGQTGTAQLNKSQVLQISSSGGGSTGGGTTTASGFNFIESSSYNPLGSIVPDVVKDDPNIRVEGFSGRLNSSWGLEDYGNNSNLIYINGKSWNEWNGGGVWPLPLDRVSVIDAGESACWFVFDLSNPSILRLNTQAGEGAVINSIVLKKGFTLVNPTGDFWGQDGLLSNSSNIASVNGVLQEDVVLTAKSGGGFSVTVANTDIYVNESNTYSPLSNPPDIVKNDPNVLVTGLSGGTNSVWGLEDYADNKSLVLINGKTWAEWDAKSTLALDRISIIYAGDGLCWLVFDMNDLNVLRLNTQSGNGEVLNTIVLKAGFKIVNAKTDWWGQDHLLYDGNNVANLAGVFPHDVVLTAKPGGGFWVTVGNTDMVINESNSNSPLSNPPDIVKDDANILVTGLVGGARSSWGIEDYANNKSLVLINGRTWEEWDARSPLALDRMSIIYGGYNLCWLVFDTNAPNILRWNTQSGSGEVIDTIVLKSGFKIPNAKTDLWGQDGMLADGNNVENVAGVLASDVILKAKSGGGFYVNPAHTHSYSITRTDSTYHWTQCYCGATTSMVAHSYSTTKYDSSGHWKQCSCGLTQSKSGHSLAAKTDGTYHWSQCSCGYVTGKTAHSYTTKTDGTNHWQQCSCGYITGKTAHSYTTKTDGSNHWQQCSCGYITGKTAHSYTTKTDGTNHWQQCSCGYVTSKAAHSFTTKTDSTHHWTECSCGYATTKVAHTLATKTDSTHHWTECSCGYATTKVAHTLATKTDSTHHWTECSCGYATTKVAHTLATKTDGTHHWTECSCGYATEKVEHTFAAVNDTTHHWTECSCGYATEKVEHTFTDMSDDVFYWTECDCGYATEKVQHTFSNVVIELGTTLAGIKETYGETAVVKKADGTVVSTGRIGTGYTIHVDNAVYTAILKGDVTGDGRIDMKDINTMLEHLQGKSLLTGAYFAAACTGTSNRPSMRDVNAILAIVKG